MELIPILELGWLNGWVLLALLYLIYCFSLLTFRRNVRVRLFKYDRSRWSKTQRLFRVIAVLVILIVFFLIIFAPLKTGSVVFIPGIILFGLGLAGFITAIFNFKNTPLDQPATRGLYRISRHPQSLTLFITGCGICIAIGSWPALLLQIVAALFRRSRTMAEEKACLEQYGDSYREYMKRVPRYFLFF